MNFYGGRRTENLMDFRRFKETKYQKTREKEKDKGAKQTWGTKFRIWRRKYGAENEKR